MRLLFSLLILINTSLFGFYEGDVSPDEALEMQERGEAIIVDVRTPIEFIYTGHGLGFINIPYFDWTYEPKKLSERVNSAAFEVSNNQVKDHKKTMMLYEPKEVVNSNFVSEVMDAMRMRKSSSVVLVCRSGPRAQAAAHVLAGAGIKAYNMEGGFIKGWKELDLPWNGQ